MSYVYVALGLGVLLVAFGIFVEKRKPKASDSANSENLRELSAEDSHQNHSHMRREVPQDDFRDGMRKQNDAKERDRAARANSAGMTIEELDKRAAANTRKFLENAQGGRQLQNPKPPLKDDELDFIQNASKVGLELRSDEAELSEEQMKLFANNYASSSWGWLVSTAISFSDGGKMRLPFSTMYYISSRLNPVITVGGEIQVTNMFTLSEQATVSLFSGKTFFIQDEKGLQKEVTEDIIRKATYSKTAEQLIKEHAEQEKIIEQQKKTIEALKNSGQEISESQSSDAKMIEQKSKEEYETIASQLAASQEMIEKSKSVVQKLSAEVKRLSEENKELASKVTTKNTQHNPSANTSNSQAQNKITNAPASEIDKTNVHAITDTSDSKSDSNKPNNQREIMSKVRPVNEQLLEMLKNSAISRINNGKRSEYVKHTGLLAIQERVPGQGIYFYFEEKTLIGFCRGWSENKNIEIDENALNRKNYHIALSNKEFVVVGEMIEIFYPKLKIESDSDLLVFDGKYADKNEGEPMIKKAIELLKQGKLIKQNTYLEELLNE